MELSSTSLLVLLALRDGPAHGYGILQRATELDVGAVPPVATLYATLDRLVRTGLIAEDREEIVDGRARRFYVATDEGHDALGAEVDRMERAVALVRSSPKRRRRPAAAVAR
jgi:PadR family transcriptional regulator, regulatory protein PadR